MSNKTNNKKITIEEGNSGHLEISKVYTHLTLEKPKINSKPKKTIVIPEETKNKKKK